ncbi:phage head closure protein [Bacillus safensis]|uniref:phage head closure protein n=1 Tax=Bacillus safensis TaxID=561879 RepID=UPI002041A1C1|nr:phage head closure protein [Bacillus safensis]MCM3367867.1 phage head closure protein [Bacillus safensis]
MDFSRFDKRISFVKMVTSKDPISRENIEKEEVVFSCFAELIKQTLRDVRNSLGTVYEDTIQFNIRQIQRFEIKNDMKILYEGKLYSVEDVLPTSKRIDLQTIVAKLVK